METVILPTTLNWRPLPAPLDETHPGAQARIMTPDSAVPCRRCLRDTQPGEKLVLLSYDPFLGESPYRGASAIFIHADNTCQLADVRADGGVVPKQQSSRQLSVRAFSPDHMLKKFDVVDGKDIIEMSKKMLAEDDVEYLHLHYAAPGCFAVRVDKC